MAIPNNKFPSKGLVGGHYPTRGYYSVGGGITEEFLSILESQIGLTPLVRAKIDLDGNGTFEVVELDKLLGVGNVNRAVEFTTNRPRFGSCNMRLANCDQRWTDNYDKSLTYFDPSNPTRYHMRKVIIELGFDWIHKHEESYWFPLFEGFITKKQEHGREREVSISLIDEWKKIFDYDLVVEKRADEIFIYTGGDTDNRQITTGCYYGKFALLNREFKSRDNQILIPCLVNTAGVAHGFAQYRLIQIQANVITSDMDDALTNETYLDNKIWFWLWNDKGDWTGITEKQWGFVETDHWSKSGPPGSFFLDATVTFQTVNGTTVDVALSDYFTGASYSDANKKELDPLVALECGLQPNPAKIIFDILRNVLSIPLVDIDASNDDSSLWVDSDLDYEDPNYYSFDVAGASLDADGAKTTVQIEKPIPASDLINDMCKLTKGAFFVDKGAEKTGAEPDRRVKFVINQPRNLLSDIRVLSETRLHSPELERSISEVKNFILVNSFPFNATLNGFNDVDAYTAEDNNSIAVYGRKVLNLNSKPGDDVFLYDSAGFANFLASHFLTVLKEPPEYLNFRTDLIGYNWDLKKLIAVKEGSILNLDYDSPSDLSGVFEIYGMNFNTASYYFSFFALWAGYLIMPDGDSTKRWAFADFSYADQDADNITYHCW